MTNHPDPSTHWKHRRRLAYWAMWALTAMLIAALTGRVNPAVIPLLEGLAWVFAIIVLGYYGNNAIESFSKGRK